MKLSIQLKVGNAEVKLTALQTVQLLNYAKSLINGESAVRVKRIYTKRATHSTARPWTPEQDAMMLSKLTGLPRKSKEQVEATNKLCRDLNRSRASIASRMYLVRHNKLNGLTG